MLEAIGTLDPAIADDWFAVGAARSLGPGQTRSCIVMGRSLQLARSLAGELTVVLSSSADAATRQPCAIAEHCGCLWVCLGSAPKPLFALPEFATPGRRFISMGAFGLQTGPLRVVENFLDMAHFPFVHSHILGSEAVTEVRPYEVEITPDTDELWARGCKFVQPMASAAADGAADVDYVYRAVNPCTTLLYKADAAHADRPDLIFLFVQPVGEERCIAHFAISLFDDVNSDTEITAFQQTILGQDKPILEGHVYKRLPLDPLREVPARADAASSAYRRWLLDKGLRFGVLPPAVAPATPRAATLELTVTRKWRVGADVMAFELRRPDGAELPWASAGAHLDVRIRPALTRQYSIVNGPSQRGSYQIAVKLDPASRGGSAAMHRDIVAGSRLVVSRPKNNFELDGVARQRLLIAGGIGITPLLAMARQLQHDDSPFALHYFCRSRDEAAFVDVLEAEFASRLTLWPGLDRAAVGTCLDELLGPFEAGRHAYCCGPAGLMDAVAQRCERLGWPAANLHVEHFQASAPADVQGPEFRVELARRGKRVTVARGQTIVQALREHDIEVSTNCEQGVCGTCLCGVLAGTPDHRDVYLSAAEKASGNLILPCVSRAWGESLTLDL